MATPPSFIGATSTLAHSCSSESLDIVSSESVHFTQMNEFNFSIVIFIVILPGRHLKK